mgnify:CR=1 FL=1
MDTSLEATLTCGVVAAGDMVFLVGGSIGKVIVFFEKDGVIFVQVEVHRPLDAELMFEDQASNTVVIDAKQVIEPLWWYYRKQKNKFVAIVPNYG